MSHLAPIDSLNRASWPRMKNDLLGGKEALTEDLDALRVIFQITDDIAGYVTEEDGFVDRTWRHLAARRGVTQFIHAGAPLPVRRPPHWSAWDSTGDRGPVVYVEPDRVLAAKGRNDLEDHTMVTVLDGDLREPAALFSSERIHKLIDFSEPVAVIAPSVLDRVRAGRAAGILAELQGRLSDHSFLVATHALDPEYPAGTELAQQLESRLRLTLNEDLAFRTQDEIEHLFDAWALLPPGVTRCGGWWPSGPRLRELTVTEQLIVGVVAMPPP
jgi:hypothetical protein